MPLEGPILLTGARGSLGEQIQEIWSATRIKIIATDRAELDITNLELVDKLVAELKPAVIVNAAAYNNVDGAEDPALYQIALAVNATGPTNLALTAKKYGAKFIHLSTDYVFSGVSNPVTVGEIATIGYKETANPDPINAYARTKFLGEEAVKEVGGEYYLVRSSRLFGPLGSSPDVKESFVHLMLRVARERPLLKLVNDEWGCPTYTPHLATALLSLLTKPYPFGIYHLVNAGGGLTWYDFAKKIFALAGITTPIESVPGTVYSRPARRPGNVTLIQTRGPKLPSLDQGLSEFIHLLPNPSSD